jgi:tetratricopeptide (TPR) repeat protein
LLFFFVLQKGDDTSDTLFSLGIVHHNRRKFDLALSCHTRALKLREAVCPEKQLLIASSLRGIANAHWALHQLPEAREAAQRALIIHQTLMPINETNVATSLATMANIHHDSGDNTRAIELGTRALDILERSEPANSPKLAALYHNLAAFYLTLEALPEARDSFEKALKIYSSILPPKHPTRIAIGNHIQCIVQLHKERTERSQNDSHE